MSKIGLIVAALVLGGLAALVVLRQRPPAPAAPDPAYFKVMEQDRQRRHAELAELDQQRLQGSETRSLEKQAAINAQFLKIKADVEKLDALDQQLIDSARPKSF